MMPPKTPSGAGPRLIQIGEEVPERFPCCGIKDPAHPGGREKRCWLRANAKLGLRAKSLIAPDGRTAGYIEAIPGESAWRAVEAAGYLFIHCVWVHNRQYQGRGWGRLMVDACVEDARKARMKGVAAMVRGGPWMAGRDVFLAAGFEPVDAAPPDYEMLALKFKRGSANPAFQRDLGLRLGKYKRGLTLIRSAQCPYIAKFAAEIEETAQSEYGVKPRVVELRSAGDAQGAPTPYAVFSLIHNGKLLADHPISRTRFRNIMRGIGK